MQAVTIEPMTEADVEAALAIDLASFPIDATRTPELREKQLREELGRSWARLRVAKEGERIVGYLLSWHVVDEIHLLDVAVDPAVRRRGIGRALVDDLLAYARARSASKVLLEVRASNAAALALYDRLGFSRVNVRPRYYPDDEDAVEMSLSL
jgi:ribosomal-protein-alanine N-acetyltransferase